MKLRTAGLWLALCVWAGPQSSWAQDDTDEAALARIRGEIIQMIGAARCRNLVHCRLLPLGMDTCGAPTEYLAYSSAFTDIAALETKASEYAFLQEELQGRQAEPPGCKTRAQPQAVCIDNHCRVQ